MKLRSLIQLIVLLNLFGNTLYSKNTISIGVVSSYNNSNINFYNNFFPQNIRTNTISNYNFSFLTEIKNSKNTGIRIEFSKLRRGWSENLNSQLISNEFEFLNLPIMMTTYFGEKNLKLNFSLGPYAEFQIKNNLNDLKYLFPDYEFFFNDKRDNSFGYGIKASGGFSIDFNKSSILFLVSYLYNFDNLIDVEQKSNLIPDISNLRTLSFSLVYLFNFTKNEI